MNKTKIDWCDMTWNPVTGCYHGCDYCYARKIANRFGKTSRATGECHEINQGRVRSYHEAAHHTGPYPYGFDPTLYADSLGEPARKTKPQTIFVCSMADLFGEWVPNEWIRKVFEACEQAPQHRYLFLTKNPGRYNIWAKAGLLPKRPNMWYGSTTTTLNDTFWWSSVYNTFVSIEPIKESFEQPWEPVKKVDWVIVGAETGNRQGKIIPEHRWIQAIVEDTAATETPLFMKESLRELMGVAFVQEYPWEH